MCRGMLVQLRLRRDHGHSVSTKAVKQQQLGILSNIPRAHRVLVPTAAGGVPLGTGALEGMRAKMSSPIFTSVYQFGALFLAFTVVGLG